MMLPKTESSEGSPNRETMFNRYYQELQPRIKAYVRRRTRSEADAEDLTQEIFLSFYQKVDEAQNPAAFVFRIAQRRIFDYYRRKQRREVDGVDIESYTVRAASPDTTYDLVDYPLSPELQMRIQGYSFREIAEKLELHEVTVRRRVHTERRALKQKVF